MKFLLTVTTLGVSCLLAQADLIVEQKIESSFVNGNVTMKVKGSSGRVDMPSPMGGSATMIMDSSTGKITTLMSAQKMAMEMDLATMQKMAGDAQKSLGLDPAALKPVATGKKQKVGEWDTEEYTITANGSTFHLWTAPNFPKADQYKAEMLKFSKALAGNSVDPNAVNVPGLVVKTEAELPTGKMTTTVVSVKEAAVADSEFAIPTDYQKVPMPQMPAGN